MGLKNKREEEFCCMSWVSRVWRVTLPLLLLSCPDTGTN